MKYRNGFVANSSTSSFIAVGWYIGEDFSGLTQFIKDNNLNIPVCEEDTEYGISEFVEQIVEDYPDLFKLDINEKLYTILHSIGYDYDNLIIGVRLSGDKISDLRNKTSQFVENTIKDRFPSLEGEPRLIEYTWND